MQQKALLYFHLIVYMYKYKSQYSLINISQKLLILLSNVI